MALRLAALLILISLPLSLTAQGDGDTNLSSTEMQGTIGQYRVGLNYTVRNNTELVVAHYFYASQLKNIALTGSVEGENVEFKGEDGSVFHLHFVGNGSNGSDPLTFYNSIGLSGIWVLGSHTLPVKLQGEYGTPNPGQRPRQRARPAEHPRSARPPRSAPTALQGKFVVGLARILGCVVRVAAGCRRARDVPSLHRP